jgi:hypothetical protein
MRLLAWICRLTSPARRAPAARLGLEPLEDRCVPATLTVNSTADTPTPPAGTVTLRSAIAAAETDTAADAIVFAPALLGQTINLAGTGLPPLTRGETITGPGGANGLTVNANNLSRIFTVSSPTPVTISGLTLTGGNAGAGNPGGAVLVNGGNLALTADNFTNNTAAAGGALDISGAAQVNLTACVLSSNTAGTEGGAVANEVNAAVTLTGCTVTGNAGGSGGNGAGLANRGQMTLIGCAVAFNNGPGTTFFGGGIFNSGTLALSGCSVYGNTSQGAGGGLWTNGSLCDVFNSTIANNLCLGNSGGGGVRVVAGPLALLNDTITHNTDASAAASNAGGVSFSGGTLTMSNTVIARNFATGAAAPPDLRAAVAGGSLNNFVGVGDASLTGLANGAGGNQVGTAAAPLNPLLGPLQNNGTAPGTAPALLTEKPLPGSPLVNAGNNAAAAALTADERGFLRVVGAGVDIGAVEFQPPQVTVSLAVNPGAATPFRRAVTLSAATAAGAAGPNNPVTGSVTFLVNGITVLGTAALDNTGKATFTTTSANPLPVGTDSITARYEGDIPHAANIGTESKIWKLCVSSVSMARLCFASSSAKHWSSAPVKLSYVAW